jgi:hypothetical protein
LQEGFSTLKKVPAIRKKVFQPRKMSLQFARGFFNPEKRPCNLHGHFPPPYRLQTPLPDSTPGAENGKISMETGKDVAA